MQMPMQTPTPTQGPSTLFGNTLEQLNAKRGDDTLSDFVGEFIFPLVQD